MPRRSSLASSLWIAIRYELLRAGRRMKLEKLPMELLILLVEKDGDLVTRQEIVGRLWGADVFLDTEHGINTAIRKVRTVLRDDPERPRFVQTVSGKGYRFIAELRNGNGTATSALPQVVRVLLKAATWRVTSRAASRRHRGERTAHGTATPPSLKARVLLPSAQPPA